MNAQSERRQATILFADISGFTSLSEILDPEDVTSIINESFSLFSKIIVDHGGAIDKYIGDCIMATFGIPKAIERAPSQAVNSAIEMLKALEIYNETSGLNIPLKLHFGINSGEVIAGTIGSPHKKEYTVIGDAVNLASRLEDLSEANQILVGPDTYNLTKKDFNYSTLKTINVKGKQNAVTVYEAQSRKQSHLNLGLSYEKTLESSLVGRQKEMDKLELQIMKLINGEGSIISISGEAGIGKSRLLNELKECDFCKRVHFFEGKALSFGKNLSYHPIIDIIRNWSNISKDDKDEDILFKLKSSIRTVIPDEAESILPFITLIMGLEPDDSRLKTINNEALQKMIQKNIKYFIQKSAELSPLVFVLEDMHWADRSTLELMSSLLPLINECPIMFINLFRAGYYEEIESLLETISEKYSKETIQIELKQLNRMETSELIEQMLLKGKLPLSLEEIIWQKSEGNPFFIKEVIHSLIEYIQSEEENSNGEEVSDLNEMRIPGNVNDLIMTRVDRLEEESKELLRIASVMGRRFFYRILSNTMDKKEGLEGLLSSLQEKQFIQEQIDHDELEYMFNHALVQETIYKSILNKRRKELHLQVADCIEREFHIRLKEFYGMLAYHYSIGEKNDKAEEFLIKAGDSALQSSASSEALSYFKNALSLFDKKDKGERAKTILPSLEKKIAIAYYNKGHYEEADKHFIKALRHLNYRSSQSRLLMILKFAVAFMKFLRYIRRPEHRSSKNAGMIDKEIIDIQYKRLWNMAMVDSTKFFFESFLLIDKVVKFKISELPQGSRLFCDITLLFILSGFFFSVGEKILQYVKPEINDEKTKAVHKLTYVWWRHYNNDWSEPYDPELVDYLLHQGEFLLINAYNAIFCRKFLERGDFEKYKMTLDAVKNVAENFENDSAHIFIYECHCRQSIMFHDYENALKEAEKAISVCGAIGQINHVKLFLGIKAYSLVNLKRHDEAEELLQYIAHTIRGERVQYNVLIDFFYRADFIFQLGKMEEIVKKRGGNIPKQIIKSCSSSMKKCLKNSNSYSFGRVEIYMLAGRFFWLSGNPGKALSMWTRSISEGENLKASFPLARAYKEAGRYLSEKGDISLKVQGMSSSMLLAKAKAIFDENRMDADLLELNNNYIR